jgi:hypothetical protein
MATLLLESVRQTFGQTFGMHRKHLQYMKPKREIQFFLKKTPAITYSTLMFAA